MSHAQSTPKGCKTHQKTLFSCGTASLLACSSSCWQQNELRLRSQNVDLPKVTQEEGWLFSIKHSSCRNDISSKLCSSCGFSGVAAGDVSIFGDFGRSSCAGTFAHMYYLPLLCSQQGPNVSQAYQPNRSMQTLVQKQTSARLASTSATPSGA